MFLGQDCNGNDKLRDSSDYALDDRCSSSERLSRRLSSLSPSERFYKVLDPAISRIQEATGEVGNLLAAELSDPCVSRLRRLSTSSPTKK
jgi:hypothetical protein